MKNPERKLKITSSSCKQKEKLFELFDGNRLTVYFAFDLIVVLVN